MKKTNLVRLVTLALAAVMLLGTWTTVLAEDVTVVRILTQFGEATKHAGIDAISAIVEQKYPQYKFEAIHLPYANYVERLKQEIAAGDPPSIFTGRPQEFPEFVRAGKVLDLTDFDWAKTFDATALSEATFPEDGRIYSMPYDKEAKGVWYRQEMFDELGLSIPTTKSEWIAVCEAFKAAGITPIAFGGAETDPCNYTLEGFTYPLLFNTNQEANAKIVAGELSILDVPEYKAAMINAYEMFIPYIEKNDMSIPREKAYDMFTGKERPMTWHGNWVVGVFRAADPQGQFGIFPLPWSETADENFLHGGTDDSMMIAAEGNVDAAIKWMEVAASPEGLNAWAAQSGALTASTLASEVTAMDPMSASILGWFNQGRVFYRQTLTVLSGNYSAEWQNIAQKFFSDGIDAYAAGVSAEEFVDGYLKEIDARFQALK